MSLISIVIPAYREAKNLPIVTAHIVQTMSTHIAEAPSISYEILIVDDGSPDDTWSVIQELCTTYVQVRGIALSRNFGKELAITAGLEAARGDAILTMDADGQHPVEQIPAFVRTWQEGYDIVYNKRPEIDGASWLKRYTSHMFYAIFNSISEFKLEPQTTDYRLLSRDVVDSYLRFREKNRMYRGLVDWM
jgi:dolichol-phosphate mannosyltransferase